MGTPNPPRGVENFPPRYNAPSRIRTCGLLLRRESLYPAELSGPVLVFSSTTAIGTSAASANRFSVSAESPFLPISARWSQP